MSGTEANRADGKKQPVQECAHIRRVGTVTCGLTFILYGILFLMHTVLPQLNYTIIFRLWPVILILLGVEILVGTAGKKQEKTDYVYDFAAVLLIMAMTFFVMVMALMDYGLTTGRIMWQEGIYYGI